MSSCPNSIGLTNQKPQRAGKSAKIHDEIHPDTKPKWRREDKIAATADSFASKMSAVQQMEAHQPPSAVGHDSFSNVSRGRGRKPVDTDQFVAHVSPKVHRDQVIDHESEKFASSSGIAQLIGEKDRASPPRPEGKSKAITRDVHPGVAPQVGHDAARLVESEKFAGDLTHGGALGKLGDTDHPSTCRKRVVAGRKNTDDIINPQAAPHVIKRRTTHALGVMTTFEQAIHDREEARKSAVDAQSRNCNFLSSFSPSEAKPYHPGLKQVPHGSPRGKLPSESGIAGFPGLGNKSGELPRGCKHFDPTALPSENHEKRHHSTSSFVGAGTVEDLSASVKLHKPKYDKIMDSSRITTCMEHPDHRPFSQKADLKSKKLSNIPNQNPIWWPKSEASLARGVNTRCNLPCTTDTTSARPGRRVVQQTGSSTPSWWPSSS